jgi:hypothetical protein
VNSVDDTSPLPALPWKSRCGAVPAVQAAVERTIRAASLAPRLASGVAPMLFPSFTTAHADGADEEREHPPKDAHRPEENEINCFGHVCPAPENGSAGPR